MPPGLKVLSAAGEQKNVFEKGFRILKTPEVCLTIGTASKIKSPLRNIKHSSRLFLFLSTGNISNTTFLLKFLLLIQNPWDCLYTLGPRLSCYIRNFFFPTLTIYTQLIRSSCTWLRKGFPGICSGAFWSLKKKTWWCQKGCVSMTPLRQKACVAGVRWYAQCYI